MGGHDQPALTSQNGGVAQRWRTPDDDFAPITMSWLAVDEWLAGLPSDTTALARRIAWSPVLTEQSSGPGRAGPRVAVGRVGLLAGRAGAAAARRVAPPAGRTTAGPRDLPVAARPPLDLLADRGQHAAAAHVAEEFQRAWAYQRTQSRESVPTTVTHVCGHSQNSTAPALRILREVLPVEDGDGYRLVLHHPHRLTAT